MARELARDPRGGAALAEFAAASGADVPHQACAAPTAELRADRAWELAVVATEVAADETFRSRGGELAGALGFSIGAYAALRSAGALTPRQIVTMIDIVLDASRELPLRYAMAAVTGSELAAVEAHCRPGEVEVSAVLTPGQVIVAGEAGAVDRLGAAIAPAALRVTPVPVRWPLHTSLMQAVADRLESARDHVGRLRELRHPVYSGIDGSRVTSPRDGWALLVHHLVRPQRFDMALPAALADGFERTVELGPGDTLTRLARRLGSVPALAPLPGAGGGRRRGAGARC